MPQPMRRCRRRKHAEHERSALKSVVEAVGRCAIAARRPMNSALMRIGRMWWFGRIAPEPERRNANSLIVVRKRAEAPRQPRGGKGP